MFPYNFIPNEIIQELGIYRELQKVAVEKLNWTLDKSSKSYSFCCKVHFPSQICEIFSLNVTISISNDNETLILAYG